LADQADIIWSNINKLSNLTDLNRFSQELSKKAAVLQELKAQTSYKNPVYQAQFEARQKLRKLRVVLYYLVFFGLSFVVYETLELRIHDFPFVLVVLSARRGSVTPPRQSLRDLRPAVVSLEDLDMDEWIKFFQYLLENSVNQINALTAVAALLVSLLSIFLTIATLYMQRNHNFASLTPVASILVGDYENMLEVKLRNSGVGPLIIKRVTFTDGQRKSNELISLMPELPEGIGWSTFTEEIQDWCIAPDHEVIFMKLEGDPGDSDFAAARGHVRKALSPLRVIVDYRYIYNRKMPLKQRDLSWFGRHFT
jgi:hypothetical protein